MFFGEGCAKALGKKLTKKELRRMEQTKLEIWIWLIWLFVMLEKKDFLTVLWCLMELKNQMGSSFENEKSCERNRNF